jgi:hypothetical protein
VDETTTVSTIHKTMIYVYYREIRSLYSLKVSSVNQLFRHQYAELFGSLYQRYIITFSKDLTTTASYPRVDLFM